MMKLTQGIKQQQTIKLSNAMQQSMKILQMSHFELQQFVDKALINNPFLEDASNEVLSNQKSNDDYNVDTLQNISAAEFSSHNNYHSLNKRSKSSNNDLTLNIKAIPTLRDKIIEQIEISITSNSEQIIAYYLLDSIENNGYIKCDLSRVAIDLRCDQMMIESVLNKLQTFEPVGIFARNLKECLQIQLLAKNLLDDKYKILLNNLELLGKQDIKALKKICNVSSQQLINMIEQIKSLNPKPASGFIVEQTIFKIPDVILDISDDSSIIKLQINANSIPKLQVNEALYMQIKSNHHYKQDKKFATQSILAANNLVKFLKQRVSTLLLVTRYIVEEQIDFFTKGIMYLKPMTLIYIAQVTGFNESTISRCIANKYIATPNGIYGLKYFFSKSVSGKMRTEVSNTKIKELVKQIIANEDSNSILSDDAIAKELEKFNITIARRTVAKYREILQIPTSAMRKKVRGKYF